MRAGLRISIKAFRRLSKAEHFLQEHFAPLQNQLELLLETLADDVGKCNFESMTEAEIDMFFDSYLPNGEFFPNFENWGFF